MSKKIVTDQNNTLIFEYELDVDPQTLWHALTIAEFRAKWLPDLADKQAETSSFIPGKQVCYKMREKTPPFLETHITFRIAVGGKGNTLLTIIHEMTDKCVCTKLSPANNNQVPLMLAV